MVWVGTPSSRGTGTACDQRHSRQPHRVILVAAAWTTEILQKHHPEYLRWGKGCGARRWEGIKASVWSVAEMYGGASKTGGGQRGRQRF